MLELLAGCRGCDRVWLGRLQPRHARRGNPLPVAGAEPGARRAPSL